MLRDACKEIANESEKLKKYLGIESMQIVPQHSIRVLKWASLIPKDRVGALNFFLSSAFM